MDIQILEIEKEDLNFCLQELNLIASKLEDINKDSLIFSKEIINDSIKKINCEIEYTEQQLQQLDNDIKNWGFKD